MFLSALSRAVHFRLRHRQYELRLMSLNRYIFFTARSPDENTNAIVQA